MDYKAIAKRIETLEKESQNPKKRALTKEEHDTILRYYGLFMEKNTRVSFIGTIGNTHNFNMQEVLSFNKETLGQIAEGVMKTFGNNGSIATAFTESERKTYAGFSKDEWEEFFLLQARKMFAKELKDELKQLYKNFEAAGDLFKTDADRKKEYTKFAKQFKARQEEDEE